MTTSRPTCWSIAVSVDGFLDQIWQGRLWPGTAPRPDQHPGVLARHGPLLPGEPAGCHIFASYFSQTLVGYARRAVFQRSITRVCAAASVILKVARIKSLERFHQISYRFFDIESPLLKIIR